MLLTNAHLLGPQGIFASSVRVEGGRVVAFDSAPRPGDRAIDLDGSLALPGLINAHEHLELNNFPRLKWRERYANAREWIADFQPRFETDPALAIPRAAPLGDRLLVGGLKNLLAGATTVAHHNPLYRALRGRYPVRVVERFRYSHSLLIDGEAAVQRAYRRAPKTWPWIIHAAEGADDEASGEFDRLERLDCLGQNTVLVHGVGLRPEQQTRLARQGGGLIWCPSSNLFTLGQTAEVTALAAAGKVALGSDSRLSGERDLLAELKLAAGLGQVSAQALFRMVTVEAAAMLRLPHAGRLAVGGPADLLVLPASKRDGFESLAQTDRAAVRLVIVAGRPVVGDLDLWPAFEAAGVRVEPVWVDGHEKLLEASIVKHLRSSTIGEEGLRLD